MRIILLPGLDGTGDLFKPLLAQLSNDIKSNIMVVSYPTDLELSYPALVEYVRGKLPLNLNSSVDRLETRLSLWYY